MVSKHGIGIIMIWVSVWGITFIVSMLAGVGWLSSLIWTSVVLALLFVLALGMNLATKQ